MMQTLKKEEEKLDEDLGNKKKSYSAAKKALDEIRAKKKKIARPVRAQAQQILEKYEISSAAYHGGDHNEASAC
jgi:hypothetical protein